MLFALSPFASAQRRRHIGASIALLAAIGLSACAWIAPGEQLPSWLQIETRRSGTGPVAVWKAVYQGRPTYLLMSPCCDLPNSLYSESGTFLCAPSGGISGRGDRKCAPQQGDEYQAKLIWKRGGL